MVSDGNYLFWQNDMLKFGPLTQLNDILVKIGGIALLPHEARTEQDGTVCRPLPMATDARFQQPIKANVNDAVMGSDDTTDTDQGAEAETPSEGESESESQTNGEDANAGESTDADPEPEASESQANEKSNK